MRQAITAALAVSLFALGATAATAQNREPQARLIAVSVERYSTPATYRGTQLEIGYSSQTRRMADCLASFKGYDPKLDRVVVRPGVTRACPL